MKFSLTCMAAELARAVSLASQVSGGTKQLSILKASMIDVKDGMATLAATDMDHSVRVTLAAEGDGRVFVDTAALAQKSNALRPNQSVTISGEDAAFVTIVQGKTKWKLPLITEAESASFPFEITQPIEGDAVSVPAGDLIAAFAGAKSIVRPNGPHVVNLGLYLDMSDGFTVVGADTRGVSICRLKSPAIAKSIILPHSAVSAISAIFRSSDAIDIVATETGITVASDGVMYRTKLIEQAFWDWRKALEIQMTGISGSVLLDRADMDGAVRRASAIAADMSKDGSTFAVRLMFADGECSVSAKNRNGEEGADYFPADGDNGSTMVDSALLLDLIGSFGSERLKISLNSDTEKAIKIEPYPASGQDNFRVLVPRRA